MRFSPSIPAPLAVFLLICLGIISITQLIAVVNDTSPVGASQATLWTFFISLFLSFGSLLVMVWHAIKRLFLTRRLPSASLLTSLRQSFLVSGLVTVCLFLNSLSLLHIWDVVPLAIAAVLVEFYFQAEKRPLASLTR